MSLKHDNVKAGVFVLAGIALLMMVIYLLADFGSLTTASQRVSVYFQLSDGIGGLKVGSPVSVGDQVVGSVLAIDDVESPDHPGRVVGKLVVFRIPAHYGLGWDARIEVVSPMIGTGSRVNVQNVGLGEAYQRDEKISREKIEALYPDERVVEAIMANLPVGAIPGYVPQNRFVQQFVAELGIGDRERDHLQSTIENFRTASDLIVDEDGDVQGFLRKANEIAGNVTPLTRSIAENQAKWMEGVDKVIEDSTAVSGKVREMVDDVAEKRKQWFADVDAIVTNVRGLIDDERPRIESVMVRAQTFMERLDQSMEQDVGPALAEVAAMIAGQRPILEQAMANLGITASQMKLAMIEVRRSPWRLLYQPDQRELETDNLYDAVRSFTLAAEALQAASASLDALSRRPGIDQAELDARQRYLNELFKRFKEAEEQFWRELNRVDPRNR